MTRQGYIYPLEFKKQAKRKINFERILFLARFSFRIEDLSRKCAKRMEGRQDVLLEVISGIRSRQVLTLHLQLGGSIHLSCSG